MLFKGLNRIIRATRDKSTLPTDPSRKRQLITTNQCNKEPSQQLSHLQFFGCCGQSFLNRPEAQIRRMPYGLFCLGNRTFPIDDFQRCAKTQTDIRSDTEIATILLQQRQPGSTRLSHNSLDQCSINRSRNIMFADCKTKTDALRSSVCLYAYRNRIASESEASRLLGPQYPAEVVRTDNSNGPGKAVSGSVLRHSLSNTPLKDAFSTLKLESESVTALTATTSQNGAAALGARTNQEAMRASTLNLRRLIGTLGSHDISLPF